MASSKAEQIDTELRRVAAQRGRRDRDLSLAQRVQVLKTYQQQRFRHSHAQFLVDPRYGRAAHFFLDHLYGPADFSSRDDQFARVVPAMVRLFPAEVVNTVADLATLHAISEELDSKMAQHLPTDKIDPQAYIAAWQATAEPEMRERQIELTLQIGRSLDRLTRNPLIRHSLRLMRGPAKAAGLSELQTFLEAGFDAFRAMRGADEFLAVIGKRERTLIAALESAQAPYGDPELLALLP